MSVEDRLLRLSRELLLVGLSSDRPLDPWVMGRLLRWLEERRVRAGETIYEEGAPPDQVFLGVGRLQFTRAGGASYVRTGRWVFGTHEAIADLPRLRTVVALDELTLLVAPAEQWLEVLEESVESVRSVAAAAAMTVTGHHASLAPDGGFAPPSEGGPSPGSLATLVERLLLLRSVPTLAKAGMQGLTDLAQAAQVVSVDAGAMLYERGRARTHAYVVAEGLVEVRHAERGVSGRFGPGSLAGGAIALGDAARAWELRALAATRALAIPVDVLGDEIDDHFDIFRSIIATLAVAREDLLDRIAAATPALVLT